MTAIIPWWVFSLLAAVVWGYHFNAIAQVSKVLPDTPMSALTIYFLPNIPLLLLLPFYYERLMSNFHLILAADTPTRIYASTLTVTSITATCLLYIAIHTSKNATMASLIDITYPVFVALFAYFVFHENHVNTSMMVGGLLVLVGAGIIVINNN